MLTRMSNAFDPLVQWQSEMNRLMEHFFEDLPGPRPYASTYPAMNLWEDDDAAYIECELPGLTMNDVEVLVTGLTADQVEFDAAGCAMSRTLLPSAAWGELLTLLGQS